MESLEARNSRSVRQNRLRDISIAGALGGVAHSSMTMDAMESQMRGDLHVRFGEREAGERNRSNSVTAPPFDPTR